MSHFTQNIHRVAKVELASTFIGNSKSRTIRITDKAGAEIELTLFGETDALDALPRSADFVAHH